MIRKLTEALKRRFSRQPSSLSDRTWSAQIHNLTGGTTRR